MPAGLSEQGFDGSFFLGGQNGRHWYSTGYTYRFLSRTNLKLILFSFHRLNGQFHSFLRSHSSTSWIKIELVHAFKALGMLDLNQGVARSYAIALKRCCETDFKNCCRVSKLEAGLKMSGMKNIFLNTRSMEEYNIQVKKFVISRSTGLHLSRSRKKRKLQRVPGCVRVKTCARSSSPWRLLQKQLGIHFSSTYYVAVACGECTRNRSDVSRWGEERGAGTVLVSYQGIAAENSLSTNDIFGVLHC